MIATAPVSALLHPVFMKPAPLPVRMLFGLGGRLWPQALSGFIVDRMLRPRRNARPHRWNVVADAQLLRIPYGESHLNAYLWGIKGPLVLLVHGWEGWVSDMSSFIAPLRAAGYSVAMLELPAHGQSPLQTTDVHDMAAALQAFSDHVSAGFGSLHAVIAHSLGAAATVKFLSAKPKCRSPLVLIAPGGELEAELQRVAQQLGLPPACMAAIRTRLEQRYGLPVEACSSRRLAALLDLPALVVHDRQDRIVPFTEGHTLARTLRGARLIATDGLGHHRILRDSGVIEQAVGFCTRIERKAAA